MKMNLVDITRWAHITLAEALSPGDLAVDLTVGNGKDTLYLHDAVGLEGCVVGFDIQMVALESARSLLESTGARVKIYVEGSATGSLNSGVHLFQADHARFTEFIPGSPKGIVANLGYLPGGDQSVVTTKQSTSAALKAAMSSLTAGGRLAVVCYVEHPGGYEEAEAVEKLLSEQSEGFHVLRMSNQKARNAPFLLVAEKL